MCGERNRVELSVVRQRLLDLVRDLGPMMIMSDLSQFSLRKLACIHDMMSLRQSVRFARVVVVMDLVEMHSWISSA